MFPLDTLSPCNFVVSDSVMVTMRVPVGDGVVGGRVGDRVGYKVGDRVGAPVVTGNAVAFKFTVAMVGAFVVGLAEGLGVGLAEGPPDGSAEGPTEGGVECVVLGWDEGCGVLPYVITKPSSSSTGSMSDASVVVSSMMGLSMRIRSNAVSRGFQL
eukprot:scaffold5850_cov53-Attheya_sp.AAC.6